MARFARDILSRMHVLTKELEVILGPDTGDLMLRIVSEVGAGPPVLWLSLFAVKET